MPTIRPPSTSPRLATGLSALLGLLLLATTACNTVGPRAVRTAGIEYNQAMNDAANEQLLLNLVRLRYRDSPFFLEPSQLVTQYVLGGGASLGTTLGTGSPDVDAGADVSYEENPSVIYAPLAGEAFLERLLTPVQVETLYLLMRSGWSIERVLRCCVRQLDDLLNAPSADGPTPTDPPEYRDFKRLAEELRRLQKARQLLLDSSATAPAGYRETQEDGQNGSEDEDTGGQRSFYLVLRPAAVSALEALEGRLGNAVLPERPEDRRKSGDETRVQLVPEQRSGLSGRVALHTRSLMGVLYFLSQAVEVPRDHVAEGLVTATAADPAAAPADDPDDPDAFRPTEGECAGPRPWPCPEGVDCLDWPETVLGDLFRVRVAEEKPRGRAYVAVPYRGHWFYIADCDLESKSTYLLVQQLLSLQSGDPKDRASVLNYSLGG